MRNIWLITKREYLTRVKSKTFLLTTFLTPLGIILFIAIIGFIMSRGSDDVKNIKVLDTGNLMSGELDVRSNIKYEFSTESLEALKGQYKNDEIDGVLEIVPLADSSAKEHSIKYFSDDRLAMDEINSFEDAVASQIRIYKVRTLGLDEDKIAMLKTKVTLGQESVKDKDKKVSANSTLIGSVLGGAIAYAMFFIILVYGSQVMRSVMEEKINRIVEVLISSVKPFELMMGKILGVGSVGLTQIGFWLILIPIALAIAQKFLGISVDPDEITQMSGVPKEELGAAMQGSQAKIAEILKEVMSMNWYLIIPLVLFYFFAGYFAYAALFAAVGSAVGEDVNEAQSLTLPVMMPLMIAMYIGFAAINAPNSSIATWGSIIPLTSSIVMPVRLPLDPPIWQIAASMILLIIFVIFFVWLAGRIYRVGILMYGKKASFKELGKWLFYDA